MLKIVHDRNGDVRWEIKIPLDIDMSLVLVGSLTADGSLVREQAYPCLDSTYAGSSGYCSIQRHVSTDEYSGMIDDNRIGISLIFRISNTTEYLERLYGGKNVRVKQVYISAWSRQAKVLLPVQKTKMQVEMLNLASKERDFLIEQARKGDEDAIESLSLEDMDIYNMANNRLMKEDLYSIVDTCFMPQGIECDIYTVIADILDISTRYNSISNEKVYDLKLSCNDIILHLAVHEKDLLGEPVPGRRIKAKIWLQARVEFEEDLMEGV